MIRGYRIPILKPGERIDMRVWGGPGRGWIDPARETRMGRRVRRSWSPSFASMVYYRRIENRMQSALDLFRYASAAVYTESPPCRPWASPGPLYDSMGEAAINAAVTNAMLSAAIDWTPPPLTRWQRLRNRLIPNAWYRFRNRLSGALYRLSRWIEELADRV